MTGTRAERTARAIEEAALDLAIEHGYAAVTVDMICERVGVTQRTFFNHFPTKDDALLGRSQPRIDERGARGFVIADGPLLTDALSLIAIPDGEGLPRRMPERMRIIAQSPALINSQMARIAAIEGELAEIVTVRLRREHPDADDETLRARATMTTHVVGGVMRWVGTRAEDDDASFESIPDIIARARGVLADLIG